MFVVKKAEERMKKNIVVVCCILLFVSTTGLSGNDAQEEYSCYTGSLTAGFVFKDDCRFKDVYGLQCVKSGRK